MTDTNQKFAYGRDKHDGCTCPAVRALGNSDDVMPVAEQYDIEIRDRLDQGHSATGTVDEVLAKRAWMKVLRIEMERHREDDRVEETPPFLVNAARVAHKLGWAD